MSEMQFQGLHHLALVCSDMERTVKFYTEVLGMKLKKGFDLDGGYGQHFFFDMGGGDELAFFWFNDAPPQQPGVASPNTLVGRRPGNITSAHGSMNHVAIKVAPEDIERYREELMAKGVDVTPVVNHDDVVTGSDARTSDQVSDRTWLRSCYFFDPDGIMLELTATVNEGAPDVDLPVNADGIKADGSRIMGA
jgi:catechol 2,3-dioxygenase-like lactoylglutathione lyase family enzyme